MKKWIVLSVFMVALPFSMMAQDDDLYFNPKQEAKKVAEERAKRTQQLAEQRARAETAYTLCIGRVAIVMSMNTIVEVNCSASIRT